MRRLLPLSALVLVVSACGGVGSINIPSFQIPSFPPIELPSGGGIFPPGAIPSGSVPCTLVTSAEVTQILGAAVTDASDGSGDCTFITNTFATVTLGTDDSKDLSGINFLMGNAGTQTTIGGFPALSGTVFGLPAIYVQKPNGQVHVLGFLAGSDPNMMSKLQQIATIAVGRAP